jgi:putative transposase
MSNETTHHKTFKYQLEPTPEQEQALETVLWRCRELYNAGLQERKEAWEKCSVSITFARQSAQLPAIKQARPEYGDVNAQVLQDALHRLDKAFERFFRRVKNGEKPGYPRFQGKDRYHSFTYPQVGAHGGAQIDGCLLSLSKIGCIKIRLHRPVEGIPKTVTISKEADGWYACISCEGVLTQPLPQTGKVTGIDVGLKVFYVTAQNEVCENPRHFRKAEAALRRKQRKLALCEKGSKNREEVKQQVAKQHQQVKRQRADFHHKESLHLIREYDTIYLEDLQVKNMVKNHHLAKSISDAGWAQFRRILACKAAWAGKRVVAVPPHYTSQVCSRCGAYVQKSLSVRTHICPECGLVLDRHHNGALNVLQVGLELDQQAIQRIAEQSQAGAPPSGGNVVGCHKRSPRSPVR